MAGPTKKEIEKIMKDPNSPERKVYDKFLKGNPLFPDLDKADKKASVANKLKNYFKNMPNEVYGTGKVSEAKKKKIDKINRKINKVTAPVRKKFKKVTAPVKKKIKDFSNRKTKEYRDDERKFQKKMYDPMSTEKKSALDYIKMHPVFSSRTSAATELNKLINTKEERKAAGLDYKKGGMVKKCRMDGIALRGKTRAKERSK